MKQKTIALCCIVIAVFSCCIGCMNKSDCVPDSVVLFDFQEEINRIEYQVDHRIEHNPDSASHTDAATLLLEYETEYTKESGTIDCLYQYMRSDDLWELKDYQDCVWSTELKSFFTDTAPHRGSDGETNYALYIDDIDTEKMTITACYIINVLVKHSGLRPKYGTICPI